jgi:hypothetical protein
MISDRAFAPGHTFIDEDVQHARLSIPAFYKRANDASERIA